MKKTLKVTSAFFASALSMISLSCYAAAPKVQISNETFQKAGWRPYIGILYSMDAVNMNRESNGMNALQAIDADGNFIAGGSDRYNFAYGRSRTNSALDFVVGIGKVYENNLYLGLEGNLYWSTKARYNANSKENSQNTFMNVEDVDVGNPSSSMNSIYSIRPILDSGVKLGYIFNETIMPYFKAGIASYSVISSPLQAAINNPENFQDSVTYGEQGVSAIGQKMRSAGTYIAPFIGAGVDVKVTESMLIRAEYGYSTISMRNNSSGEANFTGAGLLGTLEHNINSNTQFNMHKFKVGLVFTL